MSADTKIYDERSRSRATIRRAQIEEIYSFIIILAQTTIVLKQVNSENSNHYSILYCIFHDITS